MPLLALFALFSCGAGNSYVVIGGGATECEPFDETFVETTATQAIARMGSGINLGNTFDAMGGETGWGAPRTTPEMMRGMKSAGFDTVRIPIAWYSNGVPTSEKDSGRYKISKAWFNRIDEMVSYALAADLYCVINIHWDSGWWNGFYGIEKDGGNADAKNIYSKLWTQIGNRYKNYPAKLIFENANEELRGDNDSQYTISNTDINQAFVDLIRAQGGNNAKRILLIAGVNTDVDKCCDARFKMPTDTIADRLMLSIHYYTPSTFCILEEDANWGKVQKSWGSDSDKALMAKQIKKVTDRFTSAGVPIIWGEYGAATKYRIKDENGNVTESGQKEGLEDYIKNFVDLCRADGKMCPVLWDTPGGDSWYLRNSATLNSRKYPGLPVIFAR